MLAGLAYRVPFDICAFNAVERHVHRADTQHGGVEIKTVEQALVEMTPQLIVTE